MLKYCIIIFFTHTTCLPGQMASSANLVPSSSQYKQITWLGSKMQNIRYIKANFTGALLKKNTIENFSFKDSIFCGARITDTKFTGGDFIGADFTNAYIADSEFLDCILPADFAEKAILINVKINRCRYE